MTEREANGETVFEVRVADGDMGKVIGRQGRIVKEIRILMKLSPRERARKSPWRSWIDAGNALHPCSAFFAPTPKKGAITMQKPYLEAGKIVNTHGVRGEVRIQPWADDAAFLLGFRTFYIDGAPVHVAHSRVHKGMLVVKFADYDDVNAAMTLKNRVVSIARADVTLPDGQYFQQDLIGIAVETDAGEPLGTLREILDLPRGSVYVVQGAREVLIPDRPEFVCSIDPEGGRMVVHLIEGM